MHTTLTSRSLTTLGAAAVAATLLLSGCSSTAKSATATSSAPSVSAAPSVPSASGSATAGGGTGATTPASATGSAAVVVHNADKGRTITLHTGQTLEVVLTGGYWPAPVSSSEAVLKASGAPSYLSPSPSHGCPPGVGCRPQQTDFTAVAPGTATVSATRTNCGEAMRCTDANGKFTITVTVVA
ncbi:hypothetical protein [Streptacidiphilus jiangxiensis]|uniref:Neocarzinostatin family protein n=1 Tax=Streptacidiphilus jiangxiensis TaxID=235985 RepID=A0A1H7XDQ7_STRJI|nr:hypothetical protein [Streptacidiphilus jiangxiensis]SEM31764.1 hypothetical protein SAMN05414137_123124 [Streptacidiphilus jiangxiensis]